MDCDFLKKFIDEHSLFLLNWAKDKTGDGEAALDLSQTVWLQFFHAVRVEEERGCEVLKPDNFFWKIARYVWLSYLSEKKSKRRLMIWRKWQMTRKTAVNSCTARAG